MAHHHHHHHGQCDHSHSAGGDPAVLYSLYKKIDLINLQCYNESEEGAGRTVFKPWEQRQDHTKFVESDADEELLFHVPFTGNVKLKAVMVMGPDDYQHPRELRLFKNRPQQGFDELGGEPDQVLQLSRDITGLMEYPVKVSRFNAVTSLSMHFPTNYGADTTKIYYIGLKGDFTEAHRHEVTIATYEVRPNPADHKTSNIDPVSGFVS